jgi:hypothetical protein
VVGWIHFLPREQVFNQFDQRSGRFCLLVFETAAQNRYFVNSLRVLVDEALAFNKLTWLELLSLSPRSLLKGHSPLKVRRLLLWVSFSRAPRVLYVNLANHLDISRAVQLDTLLEPIPLISFR